MLLFLKNLTFTVLVPGTVTVFLPRLVLAPEDEFSLRGLRILGLVPIASGVAIYLWCLWHFATTGRGTPAPIDPPKVLVVKGLYRNVRNPMYVGVLLVLFGEAAVFASLELLRYALSFALLFHLFVRLYEEPTLRRKFGPAYEHYCKTVPRWIPRLRISRTE
jgi:protein-S-isoprenylcysteine O-methyltransferase Ste14